MKQDIFLLSNLPMMSPLLSSHLIKRSLLLCPVIANFIWIEPLLQWFAYKCSVWIYRSCIYAFNSVNSFVTRYYWTINLVHWSNHFPIVCKQFCNARYHWTINLVRYHNTHQTVVDYHMENIAKGNVKI